MDDYISRQAAIEACYDGYADCRDDCADNIRDLPAADVRPVVRGRWEISCDGWYPYCSECKQEPPGREMTNFCPNCGADMRGENNE